MKAILIIVDSRDDDLPIAELTTREIFFGKRTLELNRFGRWMRWQLG